jgi:hypothetical protein
MAGLTGIARRDRKRVPMQASDVNQISITSGMARDTIADGWPSADNPVRAVG